MTPQVSTPSQIVTLPDSTKVRQQELVILQSQATINSLEDSLEKETTKATGVTPQYIIRYRDSIRFRDSVMYTPDSTLDYAQKVIDSVLNVQYASAKMVAYLTQNALVVPRYFVDSSKFFRVAGKITRTGVDISDLELYNKTSVIIGQRGSWWQNKVIVVNVAEDNPMITPGDAQSYWFKAPERKWSLVVGPSLLFNGKRFTQGVGITAGYKLF